jgi:hypothetical protein
MDKPPPAQRWYQRRRKDPGHVPEDAADLGTAFGLDLSLGDQPPTAAAPTVQDGAAKPGWAQRVMRRQRAR